jgi:hypothetical protein
MQQLLVMGLGLTLMFSAFAKDLTVKLELAKIQSLKIQEHWSDELYFDITEYTQRGLEQFYQVPKKPLYLSSKHLSKIKDIKLWHKILKPGEVVLLLVSLVEQDNAPWDLDDIIGIVKIRMKNEGGKLVSDWSMPNATQMAKAAASKVVRLRHFELKGSSAAYQLDLQLSS